MAVKRPERNDGGSVLMEYVVLFGIATTCIVTFWYTELFNFDTGWQDGKFSLGRGVVEFYQRVLGGIAMPVP